MERWGQLSVINNVQNANSKNLVSVVERLNILEKKETISSVSVSLSKPISKVFGRTYTADSDGFVIATLETLGGNNFGVICGYLGEVGVGEDPTKSAQGASVFRTDEDGVAEAGAYLPLSSMTMVVNKGDRWTVKSCGNTLDDNFRSQISWVSITVETGQ